MSILWRALLVILLVWAGPVWAQTDGDDPLVVVSWAPLKGPDALWAGTLGGLKAAAAMVNANGGFNGRHLSIDEIKMGEGEAGFLKQLAGHMEKPGVIGAAGGPVHHLASESADYFRRINKVWLGPWSNEPGLYKGTGSDPFGLLPTWAEELPSLLSYVKSVYEARPEEAGPVYLIYYNFAPEQGMAAEAKKMAEELGLDLRRAPVNSDFVDWPFLGDHVKQAKAVIVWLTPGPAAAFVKAAKEKLPDAVFLTDSVNATNSNLVLLSGGAWNGVIFPAVLKPSDEIPAAYDALIRKYGPVGLEPGYQAYLGFAQGRILTRAVGLAARAEGGPDLASALYQARGFSTLLFAAVDYDSTNHRGRNLFYLARAYGNGHWEAAPDPAVKTEFLDREDQAAVEIEKNN